MKRKINILFISPFVPYDNVPHAGGKIHNFNLIRFARSGEFDVTLVSVGAQNEKAQATIHNYGVRSLVTYLYFPHNAIRRILTPLYASLPFSRWGIVTFPYFQAPILRNIRGLRKEGYWPDIVVIEWTQAAYVIRKIRDAFPGVPIGVLVHDLIFQSMERSLSTERNLFKRMVLWSQKGRQKAAEMAVYRNAEFIVCINTKDRDMLIQEQINANKIIMIVPYFESKRQITPALSHRNLLFYGSMRRPENYQSAAVLIKQIFPKITEKFPDAHLYIVGDSPPQWLQRMAGPMVTVTGFVENPSEYFVKCSCLVAPLVKGAGIKIKVLEAMSAGLVVITNDIGIEGIPAQDGTHFLLARSPEEFVKCIVEVFENHERAITISGQGKDFLLKEFSPEKGFDGFRSKVNSMIAHSRV